MTGSLDVFAAAREAGPEPALVTAAGSVSYAELAEGAARALGWLGARGITAEHPGTVAVIADSVRSVFEMLHALIAIGAPTVLVHPRLGDRERSELFARERPLAITDADWMGAATRAPARSVPADERPLAIVETSGTTGSPQRVVLSRRACDAAARASAELLGWRDGDRWLCCLPLAHVSGFAILIRCLTARKTVVAKQRWDEHTTLASLVPTQLTRWLGEPELAVPSRLRAVIVGGAAASPSLIERARARGIPALASYGMSETVGQIATERPGDPVTGSVGPALAGTELRIVRGRIAIRSANLASDLPLDDGFFVSDDLGRLDESGRLTVLGRASDRLVTGGENVDPLEVERVIERCPGVEGACVFGVEDEVWGERVAVAIVARPPFDPRALSCFVESEIAPFKRPRSFAALDALVRRPSGKLDRAATRELAKSRLRTL